MATEVCGFKLAWLADCKKAKPCATHQHVTCVACKQTATRECDHTGGLVCGAPLCDTCIGVNDYTKPRGFMGMGGHRHIKPPDGHVKGWDEEAKTITCSCGQRWELTKDFGWSDSWETHIQEVLR